MFHGYARFYRRRKMASGESLGFRIGVFIVTTLVVAFLITVLIYFNQVKGCVSCLTQGEINTVMIIGGILLAFNLVLWVWAIIRLFFGRQRKKEPMPPPGVTMGPPKPVMPPSTYPGMGYSQLPMTTNVNTGPPGRYPYTIPPNYVPINRAPVASPTVVSSERMDPAPPQSMNESTIPIETVLGDE